MKQEENNFGRCFLFLLGLFGSSFSIAAFGCILSGQAPELVPKETNPILPLLMFSTLALSFLCLLTAGVVGFQPRNAKENLAANRDARLLEPLSKPPVIKTPKKHWRGVKRLQPDGEGWGVFFLSLGFLLAMTVVVIGPSFFVFTADEPFWSVVFAGLILFVFQMIVAVSWYHLALFFMQLRNPLLSLGVTKNPVALGDQTAVVWEMIGQTSRVKELEFELQGKQVGFTRDSDHNYTEEVFAIIPFHQTSKPAEIKSGSIILSIPELTIHSLKSGNDQIVWAIVVKGEISRRSDMEMSYRIVIVPPEIPGQRLQTGPRQSKNSLPKNSRAVPPLKPPVADRATT